MSENKTPDRNIFLKLYETMLRIRTAELKVTEIYPSDKIQSPIHLSVGQEAVSAGVCLALEKSDHIFGTYRSHGLYIAKGGSLNQLMAELYAKDTGCARGKGGSMHLVATEVGMMGCSAIVASTIPVACGDALAAQMKKEKRVAAVLFGDGAVDEGVFFESLNFAALKNLPVIFVCENNGYAVHSNIKDRHKNTNLYQLGEPLGVPGKRFDGFDVWTVYDSMAAAVKDVKAGKGPILLEYMTYRFYEHVGPGKDHKEPYRDRERLQYALSHDSIEMAEKTLREKFNLSDAELNKIKNSVQKEIDAAIEFAEKSPFPKADQLHAGLWA